jgi:hypothetical protein
MCLSNSCLALDRTHSRHTPSPPIYRGSHHPPKKTLPHPLPPPSLPQEVPKVPANTSAQAVSPEMHSLLSRLRHKCAIGYGPCVTRTSDTSSHDPTRSSWPAPSPVARPAPLLVADIPNIRSVTIDVPHIPHVPGVLYHMTSM